MTREDILAMEPSRELDALVAEKVMGWGEVRFWVGQSPHGMTPEAFADKTKRFGDIRDFDAIPEYSTNIANAFDIVRKIGIKEVDGLMMWQGTGGKFYAHFGNSQLYGLGTPAECIAKAALLAKLEVTP